MSQRWPGGIVRNTPVTPNNPFQNGVASGVWTLDQADYWVKQGLWPTAGNTGPVTTTFFSPVQNNTSYTVTSGINLSGGGGLVWAKRTDGSFDGVMVDTVRGANQTIFPGTTAANVSYSGNPTIYNFTTTGFSTGSGNSYVVNNCIYYSFLRSAGFFDIVTYTGTGAARTISHSLSAVPQFMMVKNVSGTSNWAIYHVGNTSASFYESTNLTNPAASDTTVWNATAPTSSVFSVGTSSLTNLNGNSYVAYIFGSYAGLSKAGKYTGTGAAQTIDCGFYAGARLIIIKRIDSAGGWYVWDSARGISAGNDPYFVINDAGAQTTGTNYVDTDPTGFKITASAPAEINASGGTFIYFAVA